MDVNVEEGVLCESCGCGELAYKARRPCRCGKMMQPHTWDLSKWIPSYVVILCPCGKKLACTRFTNSCGCGRDYNSAGTELAPGELWGEETAERWMECYNPKSL